MTPKSIREQRAFDALDVLCKSGHAVFMTLTTSDVVDYFEIRYRWRNFRHWLCRDVFHGRVHYVMNYEVHPRGHGWHIHAVFSEYIDIVCLRSRISFFGFGRVNVKRVRNSFVAAYLTKHALKAYRGVIPSSCRLRLVNTSRGLPALSSYCWDSVRKHITTRFCRRIKRLFPGVPQYAAYHAAELASYHPDCHDDHLRHCLELVLV